MEENRQEELEQEEKEAEVSEEIEDKAAWKNKARPAIYGMAGFYLAYLSYSMFKEISNTSGTEQMIMVIFSIQCVNSIVETSIIGMDIHELNLSKMENKK